MSLTEIDFNSILIWTWNILFILDSRGWKTRILLERAVEVVAFGMTQSLLCASSEQPFQGYNSIRAGGWLAMQRSTHCKTSCNVGCNAQSGTKSHGWTHACMLMHTRFGHQTLPPSLASAVQGHAPKLGLLPCDCVLFGSVD